MSDLTDTPCPRCLPLAEKGIIRAEMLQRLPIGARAPYAKIPGGGKCCYDCAAADTLAQTSRALTWEMARVAVGNDRQEQYRLPGVRMGLVLANIMRPSAEDDLAEHHRWLNTNYWFGTRDSEVKPCTLHDECKAYAEEMGRRCAVHQECAAPSSGT